MTTFRWAQPFYWREALLCLPAIPLLLGLGVAVHAELAGAIAAGAAFSVGLGAGRGLRRSRWGAMLGAALGIPLMAFIGSLIGEWLSLLVLIAGFCAAGCAALGLLDDDLWWVALQMVIALLVAGYFAGSLSVALDRALYSLAGGATQLLLVVGIATLFPTFLDPVASVAKPTPAPALLAVHAARAAVSVMLALLAAEGLHLANSYWAPMTAMLLIKPDVSETRERGTARLVGTLAGCVAATAFVTAIRGERVLQVAGFTLAASAAVALQKAHYATMTAAVTAAIVLLTSLGAGSVVLNSEHRLEATVVGGVIALGVVWVPWRRLPR
jgi:hypothetical protein